MDGLSWAMGYFVGEDFFCGDSWGINRGPRSIEMERSTLGEVSSKGGVDTKPLEAPQCRVEKNVLGKP